MRYYKRLYDTIYLYDHKGRGKRKATEDNLPRGRQYSMACDINFSTLLIVNILLSYIITSLSMSLHVRSNKNS